MRQFLISADHALLLSDAGIPTPASREVLIRVFAAGVNRPDILQRLGHYDPPPGASNVPGLEVSGQVVAIGSETARWTIGDKVCALLSGGGYAEYCVAPSKQCLSVPDGISMTEAAAIPETFFTVWDNVFKRGRLQPGESLLVHGGGSGIGTTAIQLAKAFGSPVLVTAGGAERCDACLKIGADAAIDYRTVDFVQEVQVLAGGVDVILDMVGGDYFNRNLQCLKPDGRLVQIGLQKGSAVQLDLSSIMAKRITVTGSTMRSRSVDQKAVIARELEASVWPLLAVGRVKPVIYKTFPLAEAAAAHACMESGQQIGKIVLLAET